MRKRDKERGWGETERKTLTDGMRETERETEGMIDKDAERERERRD